MDVRLLDKNKGAKMRVLIAKELNNLDLSIWWSNLIDKKNRNNLIKFTKPEVCISFKFTHESEFIELTIYENGRCNLDKLKSLVARVLKFQEQDFLLSVKDWQLIARTIFLIIFSCKDEEHAIERLISYLNGICDFVKNLTSIKSTGVCK